MLIFPGLRPTYKVLSFAKLEVFLKENFPQVRGTSTL